MKKRFIAVLVACATAVAAVAIVHAVYGWNPLCVLYSPGDFMYEFMQCGNGAPPKDPTM